MNKLITTLLIGLPLLALSSIAQAHGSYNGVIRGSVGISIPLDNGGYLQLGAGPAYYPQPYYYPAPYVRTGYARGYGYRNGYGYNDGRRHGVKHHRGKGHRHHGKHGRDHRRHN